MRRKWNPHCWWDCKMQRSVQKKKKKPYNSLAVPQIVKHMIQPILFLVIYTRENISSLKSLYMNINGSSIHKSLKVEKTQMIKWRMHTLWCIHTMECYLRIKGNEATDGCRGMEELWQHAKSKKTGPREATLCMISFYEMFRTEKFKEKID